MRTIAAIIVGPFQAQLAEAELDDPGPEDVVIETEYTFLSNGTERHVLMGEFPEQAVPFPMVLGYQSAGRISWLGSKVTGFQLGQRVFASSSRVAGLSNPLGGTHAKHIVTRADRVIPLPDLLDSEDASALVICQVGYNAASRLPVDGGLHVLVIGDGLIGQFAAQALVAGRRHVILSGHHDYRLRLATTACPELETVNETKESLKDKLAVCPGGQVDMVVDSVGSPRTIREAFEHVRPSGHVVIAGYQGGHQSVDVHVAFWKELTFHFPAGIRRERMLSTIQLLAQGKMRVQPLVTHRFAAERIAEAYTLLAQEREQYLGILNDWRSGA